MYERHLWNMAIFLQKQYLFREKLTKQMHAQSQEKEHTRARHELFSKLTRKQNDVTDVVRMSSSVALYTFHALR